MIVRRLFLIVFIIFAIISLAYGMIALSGGNALTSDRGFTNTKLAEEQQQQYDKKHNYQQYLKNIITGDLGRNNKGVPVKEIIGPAIPISFTLGFMSIMTAILLGLVSGVIAAFYHNRWQDRFSMLIALAGLSVPAFVLGPLFQISFGLQWDLLPTAKWWHPFSAYPSGSFLNVIAPTLVLCSIPAATIARLTRSSMLEAINQDYMRTALSKGLGQFTATLTHGLKNACLPVISYIGPAASAILTGSIVVEKIFNIPGLGTHIISGALNRDIELVLSIVLLYSALLLLFNLIVDFSYGLIDPRIKET